MKSKLLILLSLAALTLLAPARAHDDHKHDHAAPAKKVAGPNGGRILDNVTPTAEFFVLPDRTVQITFLGADGKAVAPAEQVVTVTTGDRMKPTNLSFTRKGMILFSNSTLPAGNNLPVVVQIKVTPEAAPVTAKFNVNLAKCSECKHAEYACTCGH